MTTVRPALLLLLPLAAIAAWLRFAHLTELELCHWDEGAYAAGPFGTGNYATEATAPLYAPPLYPWLVSLGFRAFSLHAWAAISISALAGTLTVLAVFVLLSPVAGDAAALATALLLATSQYHVIFSRLALTDALFLLWFVLTLIAWRRAVISGPAWALVAAVCAAAATWTKYHGLMALGIGVATSCASALFGRAGERPPLRRIAMRALLAGAAALPLVLALVFYLHRTVGLHAFLEHRSRWTIGLHLWSIKATALFALQCLASWVAWPVLVALLAGIAVAMRRRTEADLLALTWLFLCAASLVFYQSFPRLLLPLLPPLFYLAAIGAHAVAGWLLGARALRWSVALPALVLGLAALPAAIAQTRASTKAYAEAAAYLRDHARVGATVVVLAQPCVLFYLAGKPITAYTRSHGDEEAALDAVRTGRFDYLVTDQRLFYTPEFKAALDAEPGRFEIVASFRNDAPDAVLLDRMAYADVRRLDRDPGDPELRSARELRIFTPRR